MSVGCFLRCFFGMHDYKKIVFAPCSVSSISLIEGDRKGEKRRSGVAKIFKCSKCGELKGVITDGITTQEMDVDYLLCHVSELKKKYDVIMGAH